MTESHRWVMGLLDFNLIITHQVRSSRMRSIKWVHRTGNMVAHRIAAWSSGNKSTLIWGNDPPQLGYQIV